MEHDPGSLWNSADSTMEAAPEKMISINIWGRESRTHNSTVASDIHGCVSMGETTYAQQPP